MRNRGRAARKALRRTASLFLLGAAIAIVCGTPASDAAGVTGVDVQTSAAVGSSGRGFAELGRSEAPANVDELVIDAHSHLFNAWDLPLVGFVRRTAPLFAPLVSVLAKLVR